MFRLRRGEDMISVLVGLLAVGVIFTLVVVSLFIKGCI